MNFANTPQQDPLIGRSLQRPGFIQDEQREQELQMYQQRIDELKRNGYMKPEQKAPTWDEIDSVISTLSDDEFRVLNSNEEFKQSSATVMAILQREYMRIMRPLVEQTKDGKDALDKHLTLVRRLVKTAKDEANRENALFKEYMTQYSHMTFNEFLDMKAGKKVKDKNK